MKPDKKQLDKDIKKKNKALTSREIIRKDGNVQDKKGAVCVACKQ